MYVTCVGLLKSGAWDHPELYSSGLYGVFERYYDIPYIDRLMDSWKDELGECKQLFLGGVLYHCDRETAIRLLKMYVRYVVPGEESGEGNTEVSPSDLPAGDDYGFLEIELDEH